MTQDDERIQKTHNTSRYFVEQRQVAWVLLIGVFAWGIFGYWRMPQRKDPDIPVRECLTVTPWPGQPAEKIEELVTRKVEERIAQNSKVTEIRSVSRNGSSYVYAELDESTKDADRQFDDIKIKLDALTGLPEGAGPVQFIKDFGDTAALMLTVASPPLDRTSLDLRLRGVEQAITRTRAGSSGNRFSVVLLYPETLDPQATRRPTLLLRDRMRNEHMANDVRLASGSGFILLDGDSAKSDAELADFVRQFVAGTLQQAEFDPDVRGPVVVREPGQLHAAFSNQEFDKYTYRELDDFTDKIAKNVKTAPQVARVSRSGVLEERVYLNYSRDRLAAYGVQPATLPTILSARNTLQPGGTLDVGGRNLSIAPTGEFRSEREIGDVVITQAADGTPIYLRDLVEISRGYQSPARFLNYLTWRDAQGQWQRTRAITLAMDMRQGEQISAFGKAVDDKLRDVRSRLPGDLVFARTSDQPRQVRENIDLFMRSLWEAVGLVVLVSLIGFWEWRSALLMALAIPITLAMTFGMMDLLGIDLQQVSIATLIIALGLLVDDPVVAGDAIKRELGEGHPPEIAAWWGPTKLARAILFATITNIVAYLPFLLLPGDTGRFIFSLPVVITCSLVASRIASMTFIPLLGRALLRGERELPIAERRTRGFAALYYRFGSFAIQHRWAFLGLSLAFLALGGFFLMTLRPQFFPHDLSYLSYLEAWLPDDASFDATETATEQAERVLRNTAEKQRIPLQTLTSFIGGGGPRFWFSVPPEPPQLNYAQVLIEVRDKHDTERLAGPAQEALSAQVAGARVDVRQLETGKPVGIPVSIRISGDDIPALRAQAERLKAVLRSVPTARRVRDNWGQDTLTVRLKIDPDRANLAGVTNLDVAEASSTAINGRPVGSLREGDRTIPVVAAPRLEERSVLGDLQNIYVFSRRDLQRVPLRQVATLDYRLEPATLWRFNQFRTITVSAFPAEGSLPSDVLQAARPRIDEIARTLPPGFRLEIAGEYKEQQKGFASLAMVMAVSVVAIFLALVIQFRHAVKPLVVFAAIPYGVTGALAALWIMGSPFGFMAFLGIASLVGVIVSHIIVLFDFIEERHAEGDPLQEALLDAGVLRLRPVLITVGATVIALFPLAAHGGPLWEPLCYAQIGGLTVATMITLVLVPVLYATFVLDLRWIRWEEAPTPIDTVTETAS